MLRSTANLVLLAALTPACAAAAGSPDDCRPVRAATTWLRGQRRLVRRGARAQRREDRRAAGHTRASPRRGPPRKAAGNKGPATVFLRGGAYYLAQTLTLGREDSGTADGADRLSR